MIVLDVIRGQLCGGGLNITFSVNLVTRAVR
jgi:hypothetical protein